MNEIYFPKTSSFTISNANSSDSHQYPCIVSESVFSSRIETSKSNNQVKGKGCLVEGSDAVQGQEVLGLSS